MEHADAAVSGTRSPQLIVVEDNPADVELISISLEQCYKHEPKVMTDGQSAIDFAISSDLSCGALFIVDLNLPKRSGFEVLEAVRSRTAQYERVTAVVLSSSDRPADCERALALGAGRFIQKPRNLDEVAELGACLCGLLKHLGTS